MVTRTLANNVVASVVTSTNFTMNVNTVNPFSYNTNDTSSYNYKRLDPSTFWNPSSYLTRKPKKKKINRDEGFKKVVRNVKTLPDHLIGRFKHNKEVSKKSKVFDE